MLTAEKATYLASGECKADTPIPPVKPEPPTLPVKPEPPKVCTQEYAPVCGRPQSKTTCPV